MLIVPQPGDTVAGVQLARNRAVGRDGDTLARHQFRIVGPLKRTGIRCAEFREMQTVEDLAAGGNKIGFRRQAPRRFDRGG